MLGILLAIALSASSGAGAGDAFDEADTKLNAAYGALAAQLDAGDRLRLRDTQRVWIVDRNRSCGNETTNACATRKTLQRTAELEAAIGQTRTYLTMADGRLLTLEGKLDDACRSPAQDVDGPVCSRRDAVVALLERRGWCYGPDGALGVDERWMRAGPRCHN